MTISTGSCRKWNNDRISDVERERGAREVLVLSRCLCAVTWLTRLPPDWLKPTESCLVVRTESPSSADTQHIVRGSHALSRTLTHTARTVGPGMSSLCVLRTRCFLRQVFPRPPAAMQRNYSLDVSAPLLRTQGYVDGRWVSAATAFPVLDPATGKEIARVSDCGPAEAKQAVDAAYKAFHSWKQSTAKVRLNRARKTVKTNIKQSPGKECTNSDRRNISSTAKIQTLIRLG